MWKIEEEGERKGGWVETRGCTECLTWLGRWFLALVLKELRRSIRLALYVSSLTVILVGLITSLNCGAPELIKLYSRWTGQLVANDSHGRHREGNLLPNGS